MTSEKAGQWALAALFFINVVAVVFGVPIALIWVATQVPGQVECADGEVVNHGPQGNLPFICSDGKVYLPPNSGAPSKSVR